MSDPKFTLKLLFFIYRLGFIVILSIYFPIEAANGFFTITVNINENFYFCKEIFLDEYYLSYFYLFLVFFIIFLPLKKSILLFSFLFLLFFNLKITLTTEHPLIFDFLDYISIYYDMDKSNKYDMFCHAYRKFSRLQNDYLYMRLYIFNSI